MAIIIEGIRCHCQNGGGHQTKNGDITGGKKVAVLINGGSASASEIVAGAIQDYERGKLVGTPTYGKGSVQEWIPLINDMGAIRITIALWYTPLGRQISEEGLLPDLEVGITEGEFEAGEDPQLAHAIALLQS